MAGIWGNIFFFLIFKLSSKFPLVSFHNEDQKYILTVSTFIIFSATLLFSPLSLLVSLSLPLWSYLCPLPFLGLSLQTSSWLLGTDSLPWYWVTPIPSVYCHCCPCSELCASFQMNSRPPCTLREVASSSLAFICPLPV